MNSKTTKTHVRVVNKAVFFLPREPPPPPPPPPPTHPPTSPHLGGGSNANHPSCYARARVTSDEGLLVSALFFDWSGWVGGWVGG